MITVLLILIVMTVSAIDFTFSSERLKAGARQVQSALAGARDRAIFAKERRGLRFLVNSSDPSTIESRVVTSMIYIGASGDWTEGLIRLERLDNNNDNIADTEDANGNNMLDAGEDTNGNNNLDKQQVLIVRGDAQCAWYTLKERGFLGYFEDLNLNGVLDAGEDQNGNGLLDLDALRIKIPADENGSWYTVLTHRLTATNLILELVTPYRDPGNSPPTSVVAFQTNGPSTYILELPPRVLAEAQPILLPAGVCIDLDGSQVPRTWRSFGEDLNDNGVPDAGEDMNMNGVLDRSSYSARMDVLFSPRGVVTGSVAAEGLLHLYIAELTDVQKAVDIGVNVSGSPVLRRPVHGNVQLSLNRVPSQIVPGENQFTPEEPIGQRTIVSIFTQTGKVSSHHINPTDVFTTNPVTGSVTSGSDGYADNPFLFSTQGEAANQ
ncbi:hypothetical protein LBMAG52_32680 [Planctomycetia bacterium]|nr:hypothetical protein LBMAG52_32680 [Planctomycetia bacterium]